MPILFVEPMIILHKLSIETFFIDKSCFLILAISKICFRVTVPATSLPKRWKNNKAQKTLNVISQKVLTDNFQSHVQDFDQCMKGVGGGYKTYFPAKILFRSLIPILFPFSC